MNDKLFEQLHSAGYITTAEYQNVLHHRRQPVNLRWDLKTILYLGIFMFTTGLGIIIYKNIDTIGHLAIIISIAVATVASFWYCFSKAKGYSNAKVTAPNSLFDYVVLTGCLLLLILVGYLQFQYEIFGNRWGMATFIPMVILFASAYYFDHLGVLSMAIVNLAAWFGISVTPMHLLKQNDFNNDRLIFSGIMLGVLLLTLAMFSGRMQIKKHFSFTYKNFGSHLLFVSVLAAMFHFTSIYLVYFTVLTAIAFYHFRVSIKEHSFYFLVIATLYFYVGVSYVFTDAIFRINNAGTLTIYLLLMYYIVSGISLVFFLMRYNKILKKQ